MEEEEEEERIHGLFNLLLAPGSSYSSYSDPLSP